MALGLILTIDTTRPPDIGARRWSDFTKAGMTAVADLWHEKYIPFHFETFAAIKYGYQKRTPRTLIKKKKAAAKGKAIKGGRVALVWSGTLERQMRRRGILRVFPKRFVLSKPAGSYITNRPRGGRPNMVQELTKVLPGEERAMAKVFQEKTAELMNTYRAKKRVRI